MKNLFLSIALLVAVPTFSSYSTSSVETIANGVDAPITVVCVGYKIIGGLGQNPPYFYTLACAQASQAVIGGTIVTGTFCVPETIVFSCI